MVHASRSSNSNLSLSQKIGSAGLAGCTADLLTFPLDTVKVWLQVRGENTTSSKKIETKLNGTVSASTKNLTTTSKSAVTTPLEKMRRQTDVQRQTNVAQSKLRSQPLPRNGSSAPTTTLSASTVKLVKDGAKANSMVLKETHQIPLPQNTALQNISQTRQRNRPSNGLLRTIMHGVRTNGFFSLYGGITAGLQRQAAFCAIRIGLYDSVKGFYHRLLPESRGGKQVSRRIMAGTTTAFIAVALFQPAEVVKIRMQAQASKSSETRIYTSSLQAYRSLFKVGFSEAWRGVETNAARLAVVNVCELVTYDVVKELLLDYKLMKDNPSCHFTAAFISGFITTVIASPIDVVKTRYMNSKQGQYKGPLKCARHMLFNEGFRAFYKGFVPAYIRLGTWNIVMFVSYEQYKKFFHNYNKHQNIKSKEQMLL